MKEDMEQFVMIHGTMRMPLLSAHRLDSLAMVSRQNINLRIQMVRSNEFHFLVNVGYNK